MKTNFNPVKSPKMALWLEGGGGCHIFGKFAFVSLGCAIPHSKSLCTYTILVTVFNYCHPHVQGVPQNVKLLGL